MLKRTFATSLVLFAATAVLAAQGGARPASPARASQTQVGSGATGKWIEITYGSPIKRQRTNIWGSAAEYGKTLLAGAPVWRAGANVSTRLKTELPLEIAGKKIPAGEYSLFIDLKSPTDWTLIVSSWGAKASGNSPEKDALWGSFGYTPDKDVARIAMKVDKLPFSLDQLEWNFADVTNTAGKLVFMWDTVVATAPFAIAQGS